MPRSTSNLEGSLSNCLVGCLNAVVGSHFEMDPLPPSLLLRYMGMTAAVGGFAVLCILLILWLFWSGQPKLAISNSEPVALLRSPRPSSNGEFVYRRQQRSSSYGDSGWNGATVPTA